MKSKAETALGQSTADLFKSIAETVKRPPLLANLTLRPPPVSMDLSINSHARLASTEAKPFVQPPPRLASVKIIAALCQSLAQRPTSADLEQFVHVAVTPNTRNAVFPNSFVGQNQQGREKIAALRIEANIEAIALSQRLEQDKQLPTVAEQQILAAYSGWGGLVIAFGPHHPANQRLKALIGDDGIADVRAGLLNAHYTPPEVICFAYQCIEKLGIKPHTILDPCMGAGGFFGHLPQSMKDSAVLVGCEIDPISARIAKLLLPDVSIENTAFEKMRIPNDYFDLAIGNVPFGDYHVFDAETPTVKNLVHNAFFAKAMRKVKKGGFIAFITSTGTMDSKTGKTRSYLASQCNLVAAFRMPNTVFEKIASTSVACDLLILQRRDGQPSNALDWIDVENKPVSITETLELQRNTWWDNHPAALMGKPSAVSTKFGNKFGVVGDGITRYMENAITSLTPIEANTSEAKQATPWIEWLSTRHLADIAVGAWVIDHDGLKKMTAEGLTAHTLSPLQVSRVLGLCEIRDALTVLLKLQATDDSDEVLQAPRSKLNAQYDVFVKKHGPINASVNRRLFRADPHWPILAACESYSESTQVAIKAEIFTTRTVRPLSAPKRANTVAEALMASMAYRLCVDLGFMAGLLQWDAKEVAAALSKEDMAYWCPELKNWQIKAIYLSGDIAQKISAASAASATDPTMLRNLDALEAARPERVKIQDIEIQMGATFIAVDLVKQFVMFMFDAQPDSVTGKLVHITNSPTMGKWGIAAPTLKHTSAHTRWATDRVGLGELIERGLNGGSVTVYDTVEVDDKQKRVVNPEETAKAREKLLLIKQEFDRFMRAEAERAMQIEDCFNATLNRYKAPTFDGSHLVVPGLNLNITLRSTQKTGIWRSLVGGDTLIAHEVGAGKTLVAICVAHLRKVMGLVRTSMIAVPNHLLGQFGAEYLRAFPLANILMVGSKDMSPEQRLVTLSRIATGNYDAVIIVHSAYTAIPVGMQAVQNMRDSINGDLDAAVMCSGDALSVKSIERQRKIANELIDRYEARQGSTQMTWGDLGIDALTIDESQAFKNLHFSTSLTNISGLNTNFSLRAYDCFVKVRATQQRNGERGGVVFTTATPIANTIAEMFHLMRYLMLPKLRELGMHHFDQWRANFGKTVSAIELLPEGGGFRLQTRFASFHNVPQLMELFWSFADVVIAEDLDIPVPRLKNGKPTVIEVDPTKDQLAYMEELVERAQKIRSTDPNVRPDPKVDNMLLITSDGRKCALDMRCVDAAYADDPRSKLNQAVREIFATWDATKDERLTQMVFCDLGTPSGKGFCVYDDIRDKLIQMGVPKGEIAYAHDAKTDAQKVSLWQMLNAGVVRVTLGSTSKMGTGTNAQRKLFVKHDLDAPWRPDEVKQRDGRIVRQGNSNDEVDIKRYVTRKTFDAYIWQLLETKLRFILQVMSGKSRVRTIEDVNERAMSFAEVKALATGNPRLIERATLQQTESSLALKQRSHRETVTNAAMRLRDMRVALPMAQLQMTNILKDAEHLKENFVNRLVLKTAEFDAVADRVRASSALGSAVLRIATLDANCAFQLGTFRNMPLEVTLKSTARDFATGEFQYVDGYFTLRGAHEWRCEAGASALGNMTRIINLAERIASQEVASRAARIVQYHQEIASFEMLLEQPFEHAIVLAKVRAQRKELEIELGIHEDDNSGLGEEPVVKEVFDIQN